jgi:UDP-galactopyranose mutase
MVAEPGDREHLRMTGEWTIVGAGLAGSVLAERIATRLDQRVTLLERRAYVGGNANDYVDEHGVLVHRHGPHAFHTNSERVWDYLSRFTEWHPYEHRVVADIDGRLVPVPFNLTSLATLWPKRAALRLATRLISEFGAGAQVPVLELLDHRDGDIRELARTVYERLLHGYTVKQWGLAPEQLDASVTARVPIRLSHDDRYFQDRFQALPAQGYTALMRCLLAHPNIHVELGVDYRELDGRRVIFTGAVDELLNYEFGVLPYRGLRFEHLHSAQERVQPCAQVNYPNQHAYTRITEYKHMTGQRIPGSSLAREYPQPHVVGENDPYYPIPRAENRALHQRYLEAARSRAPELRLAGRLADYRYYNMDQIVARALAVFDRMEKELACPMHA